jgi:hypothetical protein
MTSRLGSLRGLPEQNVQPLTNLSLVSPMRTHRLSHWDMVSMPKRSVVEARRLIDVACGRREADYYLANGRIVNVYSGEVIEGNVAISGKGLRTWALLPR